MKKVILLFVLLSPISVFASWTSSMAAPEIIAEGPDSASSLVLGFASVVGATDGGDCSDTYHYLNAPTEKGKVILALLMTARTSNKLVRVRLEDTGPSSRCSLTGVRY